MAKEVRKITLGLALIWIFGVLFGLSGLAFTFSGSIGAGIPLILASLLLLPPFNKFIKDKYNLELSGGLRIALVIILFLIYAVNVPSSELFSSSDVVVQPTDDALKDTGSPPETPSPSESPPGQKVKSATLTIDRVVETAANLGQIRITVTNTGDLAITPMFDVTVTDSQGKVVCEGSPMFGIGPINAGEKKTDEIQILSCVFSEDGEYTVKVDLLDEDFIKLDTSSKALTVDYWGMFDFG